MFIKELTHQILLPGNRAVANSAFQCVRCVQYLVWVTVHAHRGLISSISKKTWSYTLIYTHGICLLRQCDRQKRLVFDLYDAFFLSETPIIIYQVVNWKSWFVKLVTHALCLNPLVDHRNVLTVCPPPPPPHPSEVIILLPL